TSFSPGPTGNVNLVMNPATGPATSVTITFAGALADATASLIDGFYNFSIDASNVVGPGGALDGGAGSGSNYTVSGNTTNKWYRLFGDVNADGTVDQSDYLLTAGLVSGGPNTIIDYNNDGDTDQNDYLEFRKRIAMAP
ncbi:MAG: hypothetical protein ACJ8C4_01240, partial [Gemmataceae bacterium]